MFTAQYPEIKVSETDTHVFFLNGPFSQWWNSLFVQRLVPNGELASFHCAEQYMMAAKAALFGDDEILAEIMAVEQDVGDWRVAPRICKELGRKVRGLKGGKWDGDDVTLWNANARDIVFRGNWAKFTQDETCGNFLTRYLGKTIVEGAHYDRIWGVGLAWNDPRIVNPVNWQGTNWLGEAIMEVNRWIEKLIEEQAQNNALMFDEWHKQIINLEEYDG